MLELTTICMVIAVVISPLVFCPIKLSDGFLLPQVALTSLFVALATIAFTRVGVVSVSLLSILALCYLLYLCITQFWSVCPHSSLVDLPLVFGYLAAFILSLTIFSDISNLILVSYGVFGASVLISTYGIVQSFGLDPVFKERVMPMKGYIGKRDDEIPKWFRNKNRVDTRPISTLGNTTFFAGYLCAALPFHLFLICQVSWLFALGTLVVVAGMFVSQCRASYIGIFVASFSFLVLVSQKGLVFDFFSYVFGDLPVGVNILLGVFSVGVLFHIWTYVRKTHIWKRIKDEKDPLANSLDFENDDQEDFMAHFRYRLRYIRAAIELVKQKPIGGWGLRTYRREVYQAQAKLNEKDPRFLGPCYQTPQPREVHNDYIEAFVEGGVVGGLLLIAIITIVFAHIHSFFVSTSDMSQIILVSAVFSGFLAIAVNALFFFPLRLGPSSVLFFLGLGMLESLTNSSGVIYYNPSWLVTFVVAVTLGLLWYHGSLKINLANFHFARFSFSKYPENREKRIWKALALRPDETMILNHAVLGYLPISPILAERYANRMLHSYDGMIPGWSMYHNVGIVKLTNKRFEEAFKYFSDSVYTYPRFSPSIQRAREIFPLVPLEQRRLIMKQMTQEGITAVKLAKSQIENHQLVLENIVLQEKLKLNIPQDWPFDLQTFNFLTPQEAEDIRSSRKANEESTPIV